MNYVNKITSLTPLSDLLTNNGRVVATYARQTMDVDKYVRAVDVDIFMKSLDTPSFNISEVCNFAKIQVEQFKEKLQKDAIKAQEEAILKIEKERYKKIIKKYFDDIDIAILSGESENKISELTKKLEFFVTKYGHLDK